MDVSRLMAISFRRSFARIGRRIAMRTLSQRAQLARTEKERLIAMIRLLETQLDEARESEAQSSAATQELWKMLGRWDWYGDVDPSEIYEFFEDVGIDAFDLPSNLADRMAIRDFIAGLK